VAHMADMKQAPIHLVGIPEAKAPLGENMRRWNDSINMNLKEMMLGYHLQMSTATHRLMLGPCEHVNVYFSCTKTINFFPRSTINHAIRKMIEARHHKPEGRGLESRWCHWKFSLTQSFLPHYDL
jgi:hypothetical protein